MKSTKEQRKFVTDRAFTAVQARIEELVKAELKKPDPKMDSATKMLEQNYQQAKEYKEAIERYQKSLEKIGEATYNELCRILEYDTSKDGGYYRYNPGMDSSKCLLQSYEQSRRHQIYEEIKKKFASDYPDFELEVMLSDAKDLAKALEKFIKKLGGKK